MGGDILDIDGQINKILSEIYKEKTGHFINEKLFSFTEKNINNAIDLGSVSLDMNVKNRGFIHQLKTNGGVFSAFKNHHQTQAIVDLLLDENGKLISESKFIKEALKISDKYNKDWLRTERRTAIKRSSTATSFLKFKETADVYPNLEWTPSRAGTPREVHKKFYGLVLPIEDPFWVSQFPGNYWNCQCGIKRTKQIAGKTPEKLPAVPNGLGGNPAFTGEIFADSHAFYKGFENEEKSKILNFMNVKVTKEMDKWRTDNIPKSGKEIKSNLVQTGIVKMTTGKTRAMSSKTKNPFLKSYPVYLEDDIENWEYIGYEIPEAGKHTKVDYFTYYKTTFGTHKIVVNVMVMDGVEVPFAITKSIGNKDVVKKNLPKK